MFFVKKAVYFVSVILIISVAYFGNDFFDTSNHYFTVFASIVSIFFFSCTLFSSGSSVVRITLLDTVLILTGIYFIINGLFVANYSIGYLPIVVSLCCLIVYIAIRQQVLTPVIPIIILLIFFSGIMQTIWGLMQQFDLVSSSSSAFKTTGFFRNPGIYSNYLAVIFPLALSVLLYNKMSNKFLFGMSVLFVISCLFILPVTMARTSWIGIFFGIIAVLEYRYKFVKKIVSRKRKSTLTVCIIVGIALTCAGGVILYNLKPESAQGRLLIYKITSVICRDHFLKGSGFCTFEREYNLYQADYFASEKTGEKKQWLADNNQVAFNEYLQTFAETGFVGGNYSGRIFSSNYIAPGKFCQSAKNVLLIFDGSINNRAKFRKARSPFTVFITKGSGDFCFDLHIANVSFGSIIVRRDIGVFQKSKDTLFVFYNTKLLSNNIQSAG
jgi:hypothetical protein